MMNRTAAVFFLFFHFQSHEFLRLFDLQLRFRNFLIGLLQCFFTSGQFILHNNIPGFHTVAFFDINLLNHARAVGFNIFFDSSFIFPGNFLGFCQCSPCDSYFIETGTFIFFYHRSRIKFFLRGKNPTSGQTHRKCNAGCH